MIVMTAKFIDLTSIRNQIKIDRNQIVRNVQKDIDVNIS